MKWSLLTIIIGYLVIWQFDQIESYVFIIGFILIFGYITLIYWKRIEGLPGLQEKGQAIFSLLITSGVLLLILWLLIYSQIITIWYYPLIFGGLVLFRSVFRFFVNLTIREPKSYGVSSETEKGEVVRSKGEKKVADWLYQNQFDYEYERKIDLPENKMILSDFYLNKSDIYIEYWGLSSADNEVGENYRKRKEEKIVLYEKFNYKLISIYPHHLFELDKYIPEQIALLTGKNMSIFAKFKAMIFGNSTSKVKETSENEKIFCTGCGSSVTSRGKYCVKCGTQVN